MLCGPTRCGYTFSVESQRCSGQQYDHWLTSERCKHEASYRLRVNRFRYICNKTWTVYSVNVRPPANWFWFKAKLCLWLFDGFFNIPKWCHIPRWSTMWIPAGNKKVRLSSAWRNYPTGDRPNLFEHRIQNFIPPRRLNYFATSYVPGYF